MIRSIVKSISADSLRGLQLIQLVRYASFFAIGIVLVKSGLSKSQIGNFETLTFIAGGLSFFWITGIIQALLPLYGEQKKDSGVFFNTFILLSVFAALVAAFLVLSVSVTGRIPGNEVSKELVWFIAAYLFFNAPASLLEYVYLLRKQASKLFVYGWLAFGLQFVLVAAVALAGFSFFVILGALVAASLFRWVWLVIELMKTEKLRISPAFMKQNLSLGGPIMISVLLSGSAQYIDGLIITGYFDQSVFAVFRYGARELPIVALMAHALSNAIVPVITEAGPVEGFRQLRSRSESLAKWLFPVSLGFMLISYVVFPLIYDSGFVDSARIFNIYILLIISRLVFPQSLLLAYKKTRVLMLVSALELILNVFLSLLFVRIWGISGVAYATVLAYLFERLLLVIYVRTILGVRPNQYIPVFRHLIRSAILLGGFIFIELFLSEHIFQGIL